MSAIPAMETRLEATPEQEAFAQAQPTRFTIWGSEAKQKQVTRSGKSGRIYLPASWVGKTVMVVKVD
jgi:hypothetical protein